MNELKPGISVIICTYNGAERLKATLKHLAAQELEPGINWELILIDNASTDNSAELTKRYWLEAGQPTLLRCINEPNAGTDHARRRGAYEANYSYFVFCDDDNWLHTNYLQNGMHFLDENPLVALVGGSSEAVADEPLPNWFKAVEGYYACGVIAPQTTDLTHLGIWGAGMMGRTNLIKLALCPEIPLLNVGRIGANTSMGEDGEICMRVVMQGYRIFYFDQLKLKHFMAANRLTKAYLDNLLKSSEIPARVMASYFRYNYFKQLNGFYKSFRVFIHLSKYLIATMQRDSKQILFSRDFIFYGTGCTFFSTEYSKTVIQFKKSIKTKSRNAG